MDLDIGRYIDDDSFINNSSEVENILASFKNHQVSTCELLLSSVSNIARKLNRTENEVSTFVNTFQEEKCDMITQTTRHPFDDDEGEEQECFTVGDESIDKILNGGIPTGYLIEVSGKSATGKTNVLLTLSVSIQLPREFGGLGQSIFSEYEEGYDVKTLYIPTESPLASIRLTQMIEKFDELLRMNGIDDERRYPQLDNVLTTSGPMSNLDEQDHILKYQVPVMLSRDPSIKMIIIDSLTHHVRSQLNWFEQGDYIRETCTYLKKIAKEYGITVLVANQVTDKPVKGLYCNENNDLLWKMNSEYQQAWMNGWDDVGILYRQLMRREGIIDEAGESFDRLDYLDDQSGSAVADTPLSSQIQDSNTSLRADIKNILKMEKKRLFDSNYKTKVGGIGTRPALGLPLLEYADMRIVLNREYVPILDEKLIDEFSVELGIDASILEETTTVVEDTTIPLETSTQDPNKRNIDQKQVVKALQNNTYLKNYNFESFKSMKCVFGPLIPAGETRIAEFDIWTGGIRKYTR